jgi:L,D-transpeptidase YnhG
MKIVMPRVAAWVLVGGLLCLASSAHAARHAAAKSKPGPSAKRSIGTSPQGLQAESRLIAVYKLIGQAQGRAALAQAEALVRDHPNFQLAQLVYGDLLSAQTRQLLQPGDPGPAWTAANATPAPPTSPASTQPGQASIPPTGLATGGNGNGNASTTLADLREEALLRLKALRERPPEGAVPAQFVSLSQRNKHAIAIDTSRARLYLFEHTAGQLKLVADYYISVGKLGIDKTLEGDLRTPLGVYFITSSLDPSSLKDFYGAGALPINYPNPLDLRRGKTGSGIWLHGTPSAQFSRAPKATDGCIALANPDLESILATVQIRTTPVVIAPQLQWLQPEQIKPDARAFEATLAAWREAKSRADSQALLTLYAADFSSYGKNLNDWAATLGRDMDRAQGRDWVLKDVSLLRWSDPASGQTMVVTFTETLAGTAAKSAGAKVSSTKRQYWSRQGNGWKIFFEGIVG